MNCDEARDFWEQSLLSEPVAPESAEFAEHLSRCNQCRQAFEWDTVIIGTLVKNPDIKPAGNFTAEVCSRITEMESKGGFSLWTYIKSSLDYIVAALAVLIMWVLYNAEIMHFTQTIARAYEEKTGKIIDVLMKIFPNPDEVNELISRGAEFANHFSWTLIAFITSLIIFVIYLANIFADEES